MHPYNTIRVDREEAIAVVTIVRPEKLNALNPEVVSELAAAFSALSADASVRAAILTGSGEKAFVAGADIAAMSELSVDEARAFAEAGHRVGELMEHAPFPIIGAINGFALGGGCELALCCDFLYASDKAKFGQPEVNLGVIPGFGGTQRLARRVGLGRARELCYTGDIISADEALRIGLVNAVVAPDALMDRVRAVAKKIASKGPLAVARCKRVMQKGADIPLSAANELEIAAFAGLFGSADQREGMSAFLAKRPAAFSGK